MKYVESCSMFEVCVLEMFGVNDYEEYRVHVNRTPSGLSSYSLEVRGDERPQVDLGLTPAIICALVEHSEQTHARRYDLELVLDIQERARQVEEQTAGVVGFREAFRKMLQACA